MRYQRTSWPELSGLQLPTQVRLKVGPDALEGALTTLSDQSISLALNSNANILVVIQKDDVEYIHRAVKDLSDSVAELELGTWFSIRSSGRNIQLPRLRLEGDFYLLRNSRGQWKILRISELTDEEHEIIFIEPPEPFELRAALRPISAA